MKKNIIFVLTLFTLLVASFAAERFGDKKELKGKYKITEDTFLDITYVEPKEACYWHNSDSLIMKFIITIQENTYRYSLDYTVSNTLKNEIHPIEKIVFKYGDKKCVLHFGEHKYKISSKETPLGKLNDLQGVGLLVEEDVIDTLYEIVNTEGFEFAVYYTDNTAVKGPSDRAQCKKNSKKLGLLIDFKNNDLSDYVLIEKDAVVTVTN